MKKNIFLWMGAVMLTLSSCSTSDSVTESISLSNVSHSECENHSSRTRGEDKDTFTSKLKLTYNEADQTITGEYINYLLSCDYTDAGINIEQEADGTLVLNPWNKAENMVDCICHINIYFTIRNATMDNYHLVVNRRTVTIVEHDGQKHQETWADYNGIISFKDQNVITIDLSSDGDSGLTELATNMLLGCWVVVENGVQQNNGVWFSNEPYSNTYSNNSEHKLVKYWWRKDPNDNLHCIETSYWYIGNDGKISIWMWEGGRTIRTLSHDRLTISNWWMDSGEGIVEYQRMDSNPEIIE